jgi:hypothetical protein
MLTYILTASEPISYACFEKKLNFFFSPPFPRQFFDDYAAKTQDMDEIEIHP